ncbi:hypothetical protein BDW02DRAFT_24383 [Decorospora gaudefroyi]|uniref:Uncharacterized protein n=1 Tax=Decorospora gaudefroyi TaxID=184978 RepID=A0A6A5KB03_9PLEO|nr:hypothetical protein BDW02DRAFT_24383 [Decorospora gaudefroyi]
MHDSLDLNLDERRCLIAPACPFCQTPPAPAPPLALSQNGSHRIAHANTQRCDTSSPHSTWLCCSISASYASLRGCLTIHHPESFADDTNPRAIPSTNIRRLHYAIQVSRMTEADIDGAIDTIQRAFADDPYNNWIYPDRSKVRSHVILLDPCRH